MKIQSWFSKSNPIFRILIVAVVYFVLGKIGLLLAIPPGVATAVWLPSGVALAAVLLWGSRVWPGIWLGSFIVNIPTLFDGTSAWSAVASFCVVSGIGAGSTLQAVLGAYLIRRVVGSTHPFDKVKNVIKFVGLAIVSCITAPTIGTTSLALGGLIAWPAYPITWLTWWLGDLAGVLLLTPIPLSWGNEFMPRWERRRLMEAGLLLVVLVAVGKALLAGPSYFAAAHYPPFLLVPFIMWAAFRFGQAGMAVSMFLVLALGIWGVMNATGPFVQETFYESLLLTQSFIGVFSVTGMVLAAALTERRQVEKYLTVQYRVAKILTQSVTLQEAVREILQSICHELGWEYGGFWKVDPASGTLQCVTIWTVPAAQFSGFEDASRKITFSPGVGLPGRVLSAGQPAWIVNVGNDPNFPRAPYAIEEGLRSACAFPILRDGTTVGVIEFFSLQERQPNSDVLRLLASIGDKISRFMEYRRNVEIVEESEIRNRAIIESALDCIITIDQAGKIIEFNPAAEKTFGYSRAEMIGKSMAEIIIPDRLRGDYHQGMKDYLDTRNGPVLGRRVEMPALRSDGSEFPIELSITRVLIEHSLFFTAFLRDISEQKQAEETIRILSTPVLQVRRGLLILPLIGSMDKQRVDQLREQLLSGIRAHRARVVVVDITGVAFVDEDSVKQILEIAAAARLMGAQVILTGMSKPFSEAILSANIRLDTMISVGDLQRGIEEAERMIDSDETITVGSRLNID